MRLSTAIRAAAILLAALTTTAQAAGFRLAVPPFLPQDEMKTQYARMADYLSESIGQPVDLVTYRNYLAYSADARRGGAFDLVFDSAPIIDYLVQRQGFTILAKVQGVISQSLVTRGDSTLLDPQDLVGRPVATLPAPNLSGLTLFQLFPNPMRQPSFKYADNARDAVEMLIQGKVEAALIPTPIAIGYPDLNVVTTTPQVPHLALSAGPGVPPALRERLRNAVLGASSSPKGRLMLDTLRTSAFEPTGNENYKGYADLLKGSYGY
ncbi:MAG: phosphate/phosphite/phosphonate ABC transporter substrate-binding protein [Pseudomonadota bacterium]